MFPGPAVDDDDGDTDEEEGRKEKRKSHAGGLAMGRTRVSDCLSRNRWGGFSKEGKKGIRKTVVVRVRRCMFLDLCDWQ